MIVTLFIILTLALLVYNAWPDIEREWDWHWSLRRPVMHWERVRLYAFGYTFDLFFGIRASRHPRIRLYLRCIHDDLGAL